MISTITHKNTQNKTVDQILFSYFADNIINLNIQLFSVSSDVNLSPTQKMVVNRDCFYRFCSNGKECFRCQICTKYPETVKLHVYIKKLPTIVTGNGTLFRSDVVEKHIDTSYHAAYERVEEIKTLSHSNENLAPMDFNETACPTISQNVPLNYINSTQHLNMLKHIVGAERENIKSLIKECLALSLRVDGSIDRSQKYEIYVIGEIVLKTGE